MDHVMPRLPLRSSGSTRRPNRSTTARNWLAYSNTFRMQSTSSCRCPFTMPKMPSLEWYSYSTRYRHLPHLQLQPGCNSNDPYSSESHPKLFWPIRIEVLDSNSIRIDRLIRITNVRTAAFPIS